MVETELDMTDVQKLRARIAKLSVEIDLQKVVLKKLEQDKSLVQRQLNAVLDPMAQLPLEISSKIFLQSLPPLPEPDPNNVPMLLLNVCSAWADIALSTPDLWTAIKITLSCAERSKDCVRVWLQRAGNRPLSISFVGPRRMDQCVIGIIWGYEQQLKQLEICYEKEEDVEDLHGYSNFLGSQRLEPLPLLETLKIRDLTHLQLGCYSGPQILELLRLAPNLIEFVFDNIQRVYEVEYIAGKLVLPGLRRLIFGRGYETNPDLLRYLTLPALETLSLPPRTHLSDVFNFLKRSSPPLKQLGVSRNVFDFVRLQECLYLAPSLTDLTGWEPHQGFMTKLCVVLADSSSLLPNLHILKIMGLYWVAESNTDSLWETLLRVLSSRTQLHLVHIKLGHPSMKPAADALAEFRDLVAGGMQIYIGCEANFV
ncbi:hypothetical protein B0H19DRAFT_130398 [Mycena capillaripes]|nr:hypothetical protein B0H19DRAFT_130398 [Mycena capillaripes]